MATITVTAADSYGLDMVTFALLDGYDDTDSVVNSTSTQLQVSGYEPYFPANYLDTWTGTGFVYDPVSVAVTDGTLTGYTKSVVGIGSVSATQLNVSAVTAYEYLQIHNDVAGFMSAIFSGNDKLTGSTNSDRLVSYSGNDQISGGTGDDTIIGGSGIDQLTGGTGADSFVFDNFSSSGASAADKVIDFKVSEGDSFAFDTSIFTSLAGGITEENVVIGAKVKALEADDYLIFVTRGGKLYYDADGSGSTYSAVQIAGVKGSFTAIDYTNFTVYEN